MDDILKLAKDYSKKRHLDLLPHGNNNILENLDFIYDENWENQGVPYPYEILTYLFDSYYVLPERPDLAALFYPASFSEKALILFYICYSSHLESHHEQVQHPLCPDKTLHCYRLTAERNTKY